MDPHVVASLQKSPLHSNPTLLNSNPSPPPPPLPIEPLPSRVSHKQVKRAFDPSVTGKHFTRIASWWRLRGEEQRSNFISQTSQEDKGSSPRTASGSQRNVSLSRVHQKRESFPTGNTVQLLLVCTLRCFKQFRGLIEFLSWKNIKIHISAPSRWDYSWRVEVKKLFILPIKHTVETAWPKKNQLCLVFTQASRIRCFDQTCLAASLWETGAETVTISRAPCILSEGNTVCVETLAIRSGLSILFSGERSPCSGWTQLIFEKKFQSLQEEVKWCFIATCG